MVFLTTATLILAIANVVLLLALIYVYGRNSIAMPTMFSIGLLAFGALFLVQNGMYLYFVTMMMPYYAPGHEVFAFVFTACQSAAFGILNYLSWK